MEGYALKADRDLGVTDVEVIRVAVDPASGRPLSLVIVEIGGVKQGVEAGERDRCRLALELPRGTHAVRTILPDSGMPPGRLESGWSSP